MSDLAEFLLARIAEDETVAREAVRWSEGASQWADAGEPDWRHIARHDPARVLAKRAADRLIVEAHRMSYADAADETWARNGRCDECGSVVPCRTLRLLALPYADHEGFRSEWRA